MSIVNAPQPCPSFYTAGGTLDPTDASYIVREADLELLNAVMRGQFCYVLTSRQTGKSSLMLRTADNLRQAGITSVIIDLTDRSTSGTTVEQWYLEQVLDIADQLRIEEDPLSWWEQQGKLSVVRRFTLFLRDVVLKHITQPLVIFVDEIDSTLSLPFNCDDYFAAIRSLYNKRATDPILKRLTFVLLGVASPSDLIKDAHRTPFNIGSRISLTDFTIKEAQPLINGLAPDLQLAEKILEDVLFFTGGHPYLTQKTCLRVAEWAESNWNKEEVPTIAQKLVQEMFLSETGRESDDNLQLVRKRLLRYKNSKKILRAYKGIRRGQKVFNNELDPALMELKLSGLIKVDGRALVVRNPIYESVFDDLWIRTQLTSFSGWIFDLIYKNLFRRTRAVILRPASVPNSFPYPPWSRLLFTILIISAFPLAVIINSVTNNIFLTLILFLLYEAIAILLGFASKVWSALEGTLVERTSMWIDQQARIIVSGYRRQYYQMLNFLYRDFDVKGLRTQGTFTLGLEAVFVEVSVSPIIPHRASKNPFREPPLLEEHRSIWQYLTSSALNNQNLVIIGPPGSGKTTLLKHITLMMTTSHLAQVGAGKSEIRGKIPILLFLRDLAQAIVERDNFLLIDAIHHHLQRWQRLPPEGWFQRQLRKGRCLVMLDGLDEISDPQIRQKVVTWVEHQMLMWNQNRFLVTSRPLGYYGNPLHGVTILEVMPFTSMQVEKFVNQWYLANEIISSQRSDPATQIKARGEARSLLQQLHAIPALSNLTGNPLLLTMIATIHRYRSTLPGRLVDLYSEICEVLLGRRQAAQGQNLEFSPRQLQFILEQLAFHMMVEQKRYISIDEARKIIQEPLMLASNRMAPEIFLHMIEQISGLILEQENGIYSFASLVFQEYLAATYIKREQLIKPLLKSIGSSWWRETIRLYCAIADASPIIEACLTDASAEAIELAAECAKEALSIQPEVRMRLEKALEGSIRDLDSE